MITAWTEDAWQDYLEQHGNETVLDTINALIKDIKRDPFKGLGKPEPLKHALQGWWSRRITGEHRLVYRVTGKGRRNSSISFNADITIEPTTWCERRPRSGKESGNSLAREW